MSEIRTLIVDDEPLALRGLEIRLEPFRDVAIIGRAENGREAIKQIRENRPDLVLLDIQMPGFNGFEVIRALVGDYLPIIVFVTAYDEYALDAFQAHALDYLLKPVEEARLAEALDRVREVRAQRLAVEQQAKLVELIEGIDGAPKSALTAILENEAPVRGRYEAQLNIKDRGIITRVPVDQIDYIDAARDYMCIHVGETTHILRETMKQMEQRLNPAIFLRVHRSTIVNMERVQEVHPHANGECFLVLQTGRELKVSRSYKSVVGRFL